MNLNVFVVVVWFLHLNAALSLFGGFAMKKHFGIAAIILPLIMLFALVGCSNSSGGDSPALLLPIGGQEEEAQKPTLLYWDASKEAFVGSVSWTAKTIEERVLVTGFVDSVEWRIEPPSGVSEAVSWKKKGTFDVDSSNYTLTASVQSDYNSWNKNSYYDLSLTRWADVPQAKVFVVLKFTTGSKITIASQTSFGTFEWTDDSVYSHNAADYIGKPTASRKTAIPDNRTVLYFYGPSEFPYMIKIKNAKTYSNDGELMESKEIDWTDTSLLQALCDGDVKDYYVEMSLKFGEGHYQREDGTIYTTPERYAAYADITLLSGRTIRASF